MQANSSSSNSLVINYLTLRQILGVLGLALPFVLYFGGWILFATDLQYSISDYYHTKMRDVFVGTMVAIGLFLFAYQGHKEDVVITDNLIANLAGVSAVGLALFRTPPETGMVDAAGIAHFVFAAAFFLSLAYMSYFHFTKTASGASPTREKLMRNRVYRVCGVLMLAAVLLIGLVAVVNWLSTPEFTKALSAYEPVFWLEAMGVVAFGSSWLVKGEALLGD